MDEIKTEEIKEEVKKEQVHKKIMKCVCDNKHKAIAALVVMLIIVGAGVYFYQMNKSDIGTEGARVKIENLIKDGDGSAKIKSVEKDGDLYKITVSADDRDVPVYVTKDGTKFIQDLVTFDDIAKQKEAAGNKQTAAPQQEIPKSDVPEVKLFVMSYCPFGTQMEKGILPVIQTLGSKIKYNMEFVDYAMHGDKEIAENLLQYCIEKTQPKKLSNYLTCFLKKGEGTSDACLASTGVNVATVKSCVAQTDAQFSVTKNAADKSKWSNAQFPPFDVNKDDNVKYGVQGSPTLVINGVVDSSVGRDSASILKAICGAFKNAPKECATQLSGTAPAAGFGEGTATAGAPAASCGN